MNGCDAEDAAARALLARYDIHLRPDEPLTPALHRVAGQLRARNLPRPVSVQHTSAGGHTYGGSSSEPPPLQIAEPAADSSDSDAQEAEQLSPPPPPPQTLLAPDGDAEELLCPGEAGAEIKTTDVRARRARRASAGRVRPRGRSSSSREMGQEQEAGSDRGATDEAEDDEAVQWPERERRDYTRVPPAPVRPPPISADGTEDSARSSVAVPLPSIASRGDTASGSSSGDGGSGVLECGNAADAAEDTWRRGEWRCDLREVRKRSGMSLSMPQLGAVEYLFDMTAPSVGEEWARRWTVTKRFSDFQTLDACVRALYPEGCEGLPPIPKRRFSLGGFTELSMIDGLGETLSGKLAAVGLSEKLEHAVDKADKAIEERTKLLCGWSHCALCLARPGGALAECHEIKDFFGPDEVDDARLQQQQRQRSVKEGGDTNADGGASGRRGSIGEVLSASLSRLGSFRRGSGSAPQAPASEEDLSDGAGSAGRSRGGDERRGSIGDRAMAALGAGMSAIRGSRPPPVPGPAVEEWAVVGVHLRARHNTALTAECDAPCIPGTTIPAPAVATGELRAGEDAGAVLEVRYSSSTEAGGGNGQQLRVRLARGWASVIAKDGTQLLEPQPRI